MGVLTLNCTCRIDRGGVDQGIWAGKGFQLVPVLKVLNDIVYTVDSGNLSLLT